MTRATKRVLRSERRAGRADTARVIGAIGAAVNGMRRGDALLTATANNIANDLAPIAPTVMPSPNTDLATDIPNLLIATDLFKLNAAVVSRAEDAYRSAIDLLA